MLGFGNCSICSEVFYSYELEEVWSDKDQTHYTVCSKCKAQIKKGQKHGKRNDR